MSDLLSLLTAYSASDFNIKSVKKESLQSYGKNALKILNVIKPIITPTLDPQHRIEDQALLCLIFICESCDHGQHREVCRNAYSMLAESGIIKIVAEGATEPKRWQQQFETQRKSADKAYSRANEIQALYMSALAAIVYIPVVGFSVRDCKRMNGIELSRILTNDRTAIDSLLSSISEPTTALNSLKVLYSCCQADRGICTALTTEKFVNLVLQLMQGHLEIDDSAMKQCYEMTMNLLSVLVQANPSTTLELVKEYLPLFATIFVESEAPTHILSAATLINELSNVGAIFELSISDFFTSVSMAVSNLTEVDTLPPYNHGLLDGVIEMIKQLVTGGDGPAAREFMDCGSWNALWHRLAHSLHVDFSDGSETETLLSARPFGNVPQGTTSFDSMLMSAEGILSFLHVRNTIGIDLE